jgi:hypothetical protein
MPYAFTQELPFTRDVYERFCAALPDETPRGLLVRVASETDTGVRLFDLWQTEGDYQDYQRTAVQPIVADGFFNGTGYEPDREPPREEQLEVLDVWLGRPPDGARAPQPRLRNDPGTSGV